MVASRLAMALAATVATSAMRPMRECSARPSWTPASASRLSRLGGVSEDDGWFDRDLGTHGVGDVALAMGHADEMAHPFLGRARGESDRRAEDDRCHSRRWIILWHRSFGLV